MSSEEWTQRPRRGEQPLATRCNGGERHLRPWLNVWRTPRYRRPRFSTAPDRLDLAHLERWRASEKGRSLTRRARSHRSR